MRTPPAHGRSKTPRNASSSAGPAAEELKPLKEYFPQSRHVPRPRSGEKVATFNAAQMQVLHRIYWSAPPTTSLAELFAEALKSPAFEDVQDDFIQLKQRTQTLFREFPESFPWPWKSRVLVFESYVLTEALLAAPADASFNSVILDLKKRWGHFPANNAWYYTQEEAWAKEPERFPFVRLLPLDAQGSRLHPVGEEKILRDVRGRFIPNMALAKEVTKILRSPKVQAHWTPTELVRHVDQALGGTGAFTASSLKYLHSLFSFVPTASELRVEAQRRLAQTVHDLFASGVASTWDGLFEAARERGVETDGLGGAQALRLGFPELMPPVAESARNEAVSRARALTEAHAAHPEESWDDLGARLGFSSRTTTAAYEVALRRWPEELETKPRVLFTDDERKELRQLYEDVGMDLSPTALWSAFQAQCPELAQRHPYAGAGSFSAQLRKQLDSPPLAEERKHRYFRAVAQAFKDSPPGTSLREVVRYLEEEFPGAYSARFGESLVRELSAPPNPYSELSSLRDAQGQFLWAKSKVHPSKELAWQVAQAMTDHPDTSLPGIAALLMADPRFALENPTFTAKKIYWLRSVYPDLVPYVFEPDHGKRERLALRIRKFADSIENPEGLTAVYLARTLKVEPFQVSKALAAYPDWFPWHTKLAGGNIDLYLATRVSQAMKTAPLGTTLGDIVRNLRADQKLRRRYPALSPLTIQSLRNRYPQLIPAWKRRDRVLRSKLIVDALLAAPRGTPFREVLRRLDQSHPGAVGRDYREAWYLKSLWDADPKTFSFAKVLKDRSGRWDLRGQGKRAAATSDDESLALANRLAMLEQIPESLPLLDKMKKLGQKDTFAGFEVMAVQHLLGSEAVLFENLREKGVVPDRTSIVSIPYSASDPVIATLRDKGWNVRVPPLDLAAWYRMVREELHERLNAALENHREILVLDDGGLVASVIDEDPELRRNAGLFHIVEQTRRGITVADGLESLRSPIINVAQSWGKFAEGPFIGDSVLEKLSLRLDRMGVSSVKGKHVGVIGGGTTGLPLARALREQGAIVTVLDTDSQAIRSAKAEGFAVATAAERKEFFSAQDIIIGTTGQRSITAEDLPFLKPGAILGSSSSKLVEIDVEALRRSVRPGGKIEIVDEESYPPTLRYVRADGSSTVLLASGFPLNFDGSPVIVPNEDIQLTRALMFVGALQAARTKSAGVHRLDVKLQRSVLEEFLKVRPTDPDSPEAAVIAEARRHLKALERNPRDLEHDLRHQRKQPKS